MTGEHQQWKHISHRRESDAGNSGCLRRGQDSSGADRGNYHLDQLPFHRNFTDITLIESDLVYVLCPNRIQIKKDVNSRRLTSSTTGKASSLSFSRERTTL